LKKAFNIPKGAVEIVERLSLPVILLDDRGQIVYGNQYFLQAIDRKPLPRFPLKFSEFFTPLYGMTVNDLIRTMAPGNESVFCNFESGGFSNLISGPVKIGNRQLTSVVVYNTSNAQPRFKRYVHAFNEVRLPIAFTDRRFTLSHYNPEFGNRCIPDAPGNVPIKGTPFFGLLAAPENAEEFFRERLAPATQPSPLGKSARAGWEVVFRKKFVRKDFKTEWASNFPVKFRQDKKFVEVSPVKKSDLSRDHYLFLKKPIPGNCENFRVETEFFPKPDSDVGMAFALNTIPFDAVPDEDGYFFWISIKSHFTVLAIYRRDQEMISQRCPKLNFRKKARFNIQKTGWQLHLELDGYQVTAEDWAPFRFMHGGTFSLYFRQKNLAVISTGIYLGKPDGAPGKDTLPLAGKAFRFKKSPHLRYSLVMRKIQLPQEAGYFFLFYPEGAFLSNQADIGPAPVNLKNAKEFIENNFSSKIDIQDLSKQAGLSYFRFIHAFKKNFEVSPGQFLTRTRLKNAAWLLTSTRLPVQTVGHRVGLENASLFFRLFKKLYGQTPGAFRKSQSQ